MVWQDYMDSLRNVYPELDINTYFTRLVNAQMKKLGTGMRVGNLSELRDLGPIFMQNIMKGIVSDIKTGENLMPLGKIEYRDFKDTTSLYNDFAKRYNLNEEHSFNFISNDLASREKSLQGTERAIKNVEDFEESLKQQIENYENFINEQTRRAAELAVSASSATLSRKATFTSKLNEVNKEIAIALYGKETAQNTLSKSGYDKLKTRLDDMKESLSLSIDLMKSTQKYNDVISQLVQASNSAKMMKTTADTALETNLTRSQALRNQDITRELEKQLLLKRAGIEANEENLRTYEKELEIMMRAEEAQKKVNFSVNMMKDTRSLQLQAIEKMGFGRQASLMRDFDAARETLGRELSQEEKDIIARFSALQYEITNWQMPNGRDDVIKTNELARRGGFNSSVAVARGDNGERQLKALIELNRLAMQSNVLQTQIRNSLTY